MNNTTKARRLLAACHADSVTEPWAWDSGKLEGLVIVLIEENNALCEHIDELAETARFVATGLRMALDDARRAGMLTANTYEEMLSRPDVEALLTPAASGAPREESQFLSPNAPTCVCGHPIEAHYASDGACFSCDCRSPKRGSEERR